MILILMIISCKNKAEGPSALNTAEIAVIPQPLSVTEKQGQFSLDKNTRFITQNEDQDKIASFFAEKIKASTGFDLEVSREGSESNIIVFQTDESLDVNGEGYSLDVSREQILIKARENRGFFYGMQTLLQLLPPQIESQDPVSGVSWNIRAVEIKDQPAFGWRGLNLDVSRHYIPVDFIKKQLDMLSLFKMNKFHWHLTDDQGWRIQIKKYPKLTEVGAKRKNDDGSLYDGYYTQEDIKEVVAYAAERFIDVIPEIDVPGHVVSVLAGYPELSCTENHLETRVLWGIDSNILCAGKEQTFVFLEDVFEEIAPLFPFEYFHIGGDEVPKDKWEKCPHCQKRIATEQLKDENELQSYFMARVENILKKYDKMIFGWDEILEGGISPTANIMSWTGEEGGIVAANAGHDVVMNPSEYTYLNFYQGDHKVEPMAFGGYISLEDIYNYDPVPSEISKDKRKHILGSQASVWTEYAPEASIIEYQLYPRLMAMAELTWTQKGKKDYPDFLKRLSSQYLRLEEHQINYHIPIPEGPSSNRIVFTDSVSLRFETTHPVKMVYTVDGSTPDANSPVYKEPMNFKENTVLKIASVLPHGKTSPVREIRIEQQQMIPAVDPGKTKPGLSVETVKGHFRNLKEVDFSSGTKGSVIDSLEAANEAYDWGHFVNEDNFRALAIEGYIDIAEDGVYYFSSQQDQVWIADQLLIDYKYPIKKHPKDASIALTKGKHKLKIFYLNNIVKGWASDWNKVELYYKRADEEEFKQVGGEMLSH
ncbi:family 20 glycosylhydrolase [Leptobacterium flavescens]|uniref:beta-N-acetylhexosaminidase n=1 Tax=Leptobacterium flavescens TaxID=472055 RepID=A0A6P0ULQ8_9FLAO|nr:family 20 glycosylhydrolase [Leptobacterium flavescens]NER12839.1 family 20 glycosylhydrolase [Leptobacterium flavescens]